MANLFSQYFRDLVRNNPFFSGSDLAYDTVRDTKSEWSRIFDIFMGVNRPRLSPGAREALRRASDDLYAQYAMEYGRGAQDPYSSDVRPLQAASFLADFDIEEFLRRLAPGEAGRRTGFFGERWYRP